MGILSDLTCDIMAGARWAKRWLKPEVYPIFFFIGSACTWSAYVGTKMFIENPDVSIKKRHNPIDQGFNQGKGVQLFLEEWGPVKRRTDTEENFADSSKFRIF